MALMKLGVRDGGSVDDRFIVTEHHGLTVNGYAKIAEGKPLIHDLITTGTSSHIFTTESSCFHCRLELGIPIDGSLVPEMEDGREGAATNQIMVQVGIPIVGGLDRFTKWSWGVRGDFLARSPITGIEPIVLLDWDIAVVGGRGPNADCTGFELG